VRTVEQSTPPRRRPSEGLHAAGNTTCYLPRFGRWRLRHPRFDPPPGAQFSRSPTSAFPRSGGTSARPIDFERLSHRPVLVLLSVSLRYHLLITSSLSQHQSSHHNTQQSPQTRCHSLAKDAPVEERMVTPMEMAMGTAMASMPTCCVTQGHLPLRPIGSSQRRVSSPLSPTDQRRGSTTPKTVRSFDRSTFLLTSESDMCGSYVERFLNDGRTRKSTQGLL
jgi:hypothetical protein